MLIASRHQAPNNESHWSPMHISNDMTDIAMSFGAPVDQMLEKVRCQYVRAAALQLDPNSF